MTLPNVNIVIIGHKDHGKSTLIGRLLYDSNAIPEEKLQEIRKELEGSGRRFEFAYILDSLEEEREGGLTIDIIQTPFNSDRYQYTIIDCPGHKEFIKKMLTGASQAEAAVLVVSAKEGVEDQTREHLFLAKMLGIEQLIVAVNKMDSVNYSEDAYMRICEELGRILSTLGYAGAPLIPVSALSGENVIKKTEKMRWYNGSTLIQALDDSVKPAAPPVEKPLRATVQDIYDLDGDRIVVCKVETGKLRRGRTIHCALSGEDGIIERIETFGESVEEALPGDSVGLIIRGVENIRRGEVISYREEPANVTERFTAELVIFSDITIEEEDILTIRSGTAEVKCKVEKIKEKIDPINLTLLDDRERLVNGEVGRVMLKPLEPVCLELYSEIPQLGRFVVIDRKGTVAAGIIIEKQ